MTITVVVVSDGRYHYLERCLETLDLLTGSIVRRVLVVDGEQIPPVVSGWETYAHGQRIGLAATVRHAWALVDTDYLFHIEEDFTIDRPVDLDNLARHLQADPYLAQICLLRQPWSPEEHAAGGILDLDADAYTRTGDLWLHRKCFSLNPCLVPHSIYSRGWPAGNEAEQTSRLVAVGYRFAYLDGRAVTHIGERRSAGWKL